jgi:hypothetical protein
MIAAELDVSDSRTLSQLLDKTGFRGDALWSASPGEFLARQTFVAQDSPGLEALREQARAG